MKAADCTVIAAQAPVRRSQLRELNSTSVVLPVLAHTNRYASKNKGGQGTYDQKIMVDRSDPGPGTQDGLKSIEGL